MKAKRIKDLLLSLLAIIHRDGGHYTDKHGIEKSYDDAVTEYYKLRRLEKDAHIS